MNYRQMLVGIALGTVAFGAASAQQATPAQAPAQQAGKPAAKPDSASKKASKHHKGKSKMAPKDTTKAAAAKP